MAACREWWGAQARWPAGPTRPRTPTVAAVPRLPRPRRRRRRGRTAPPPRASRPEAPELVADEVERCRRRDRDRLCGDLGEPGGYDQHGEARELEQEREHAD